MEQSERDAIQDYEDAKNYLPNTETVGGLAPADFDQTAYPEYNNDQLAALEFYLKELIPYVKKLRIAADLRQSHYERFIKFKEHKEHEGHMRWRVEMNILSDDSNNMEEYWVEQRNKLFSQAIEKSEGRRTKIKINMSVKNVEYDSKKKVSKQIVPRPRLSKKEKKRRKKELQTRKRDAEIMISESIKEHKGDYRKIEKFHNVPVEIISANELYKVCIKNSFHDPMKSKTLTKKCIIGNIEIIGSQKSRQKLFDCFTIGFYNLYLYAKANPNDNVQHISNCLADEFSSIYLYTDAWMCNNNIAENRLLDFMLNNETIMRELLSLDERLDDQLDNCRIPINMFIANIIWTWDVHRLVESCNYLKKHMSEYSSINNVIEMLAFVYPDSYITANRFYLRSIASYPNPKIAAIALYRKRDIRVIPPKRNFKLYHSYFGYWPLMTDNADNDDNYKQFQKLLK